MIALLGGAFNGMYLDRERMTPGSTVAIKGEPTGTVIAMYRVSRDGGTATAFDEWDLPYDEAFGVLDVSR